MSAQSNHGSFSIIVLLFVIIFYFLNLQFVPDRGTLGFVVTRSPLWINLAANTDNFQPMMTSNVTFWGHRFPIKGIKVSKSKSSPHSPHSSFVEPVSKQFLMSVSISDIESEGDDRNVVCGQKTRPIITSPRPALVSVLNSVYWTIDRDLQTSFLPK